MNVNKIVEGTKNYIYELIDNVAQSDFGVSVIRPMLKMGINNNFYKIERIFKSVADKDGNLEIDKLIDDPISSVLNGKKGVLPVGELFTLEVGDNGIKLIIPMINKYIKFDSQDFIKFKNYLIEHYGN